MDPKHLEELVNIESSYWWHVSKRSLVSDLIVKHVKPGGSILEGGIGGGATIRWLLDSGFRVGGFDLMPEAVEHAKKMGVKDVAVHDLQKPWPVQAGFWDCVLMQDVLEHLANPEEVLSFAAKSLTENGCIILTVPAYPMLMGPWDQMLGHHRRYTRKMLKQQAEDAGLRIKFVTYWNFPSFLPALVLRTLEKFKDAKRSAEFPKVSRWLNEALIQALNVERSYIRRAPLPVGLSLAAVIKLDPARRSVKGRELSVASR